MSASWHRRMDPSKTSIGRGASLLCWWLVLWPACPTSFILLLLLAGRTTAAAAADRLLLAAAAVVDPPLKLLIDRPFSANFLRKNWDFRRWCEPKMLRPVLFGATERVLFLRMPGIWYVGLCAIPFITLDCPIFERIIEKMVNNCFCTIVFIF